MGSPKWILRRRLRCGSVQQPILRKRCARVKKTEAEAAEGQKACEDRINEIIRSKNDETTRQLEKLMSLENTVTALALP